MTDNLRGILAVLVSSVAFIFNDVCVKLVSDELPSGEIIIVRGVQRVRPGQIVDPKPVSAEAPAAEAPPTMPKRTSAPTVAKPQPGLDTAVAERRG